MSEHVSAMGRSREDRSIEYKYLNPNLVAVITESTDLLRRKEQVTFALFPVVMCYRPSLAAAISIYLIDVVTGGMIFHTSHKAAISPVHLVHSENWIVVSNFLHWALWSMRA